MVHSPRQGTRITVVSTTSITVPCLFICGPTQLATLVCCCKVIEAVHLINIIVVANTTHSALMLCSNLPIHPIHPIHSKQEVANPTFTFVANSPVIVLIIRVFLCPFPNSTRMPMLRQPR